MLGKLFSTAVSSLTPQASSSSSHLSPSLESVQEDTHTRSLLFPDPAILYQHQRDQVSPLSLSTTPILTTAPHPFDLNAESDLDYKDVRIIVMQDGGAPVVLCDSHVMAEVLPTSEHLQQGASGGAGTRSGARGSTNSSRRISLGQASKPVVITQDKNPTRSYGAFDRRPSIHARSSSFAETDAQRAVREYREEINIISNCMFGSSEIMAHKKTGTKVHILPADGRSSANTTDGGLGSLGRASLRNSKLAQSFTSETAVTDAAPAGGNPHMPRLSEKKKRILVTRIFTVPLEISTDSATSADRIGRTPRARDMPKSAGYPFPYSTTSSMERPEKKSLVPRKTPMYAVGMIIQLPASQQLHTSSTSRSGSQGPGSYNEKESYSSSYNSLKPTGWTTLGNVSGVGSLESSFVSDVDDRMDMLTQHWDIVMRTLTQIQTSTSKDILAILRRVDNLSPDPSESGLSRSVPRMVTASVSISGKRVEDTAKPSRPPKDKYVCLPADALAVNEATKNLLEYSRHRIANGIKIMPAIARQGRWGIWREEARWISKWAGGKEQGFFFYNLLSSFLGNHTDWLQALGPDWYRRRHYQQQRSSRDDQLIIPARTIIVGHDKMIARRLVFLLSAFLSPNQPQQPLSFRPLRSSTSTSFGGYSHSPPSYMQVHRAGSLRRRVNKMNSSSISAHSRTLSTPAQPLPNLGDWSGGRRGSETGSLKTTSLLVLGNDASSRKSSAATTTTVTPVNTLPSLPRRSVRGTGPFPRPGSSGSLATDDLIRSLRRGESSNASSESQVTSRWGSLTSLWSPRRSESTSTTDDAIFFEPSESGQAATTSQKGRLAQMVDEVNPENTDQTSTELDGRPSTTSVTYTLPDRPVKSTQVLPPTHPAGAFESSVKTSINADGVIDIDVPLPDFLTSSFSSAVSSPSSSGLLSGQGGIGPGLEGFEHYSPYGPDDDSPVNVAGWLPYFHPDFVLQAFSSSEKSGAALEEELKAAMRAEPTPALTFDALEARWVTVTSTLLANASDFTIKRIRLKRLIKSRPFSEYEPETTPNSFDSNKSQSIYGICGTTQTHPSSDAATCVIEEKFVEEPVISMDEDFIDAVERITAHSGDIGIFRSKPSSSGSSRSASQVRAVGKEANTEVSDVENKDQLQVPVEVPRNQCKKVLLSILGQIAHEVAETQRLDMSSPPSPSQNTQHIFEHQESFLREGIRTWLRNVAEGQ